MDFDQEKAWQLLKDARSALFSSWPAGIADWLIQELVLRTMLRAADDEVDEAFSAANMEKLTETIGRWTARHQRVLELYLMRPPVIDREKGETYVS